MSEKILIIDDEQDIADLLEVYLKNENYIVYKFYCATDAMSCIESGDIDLAILDIMLPDINGFALCQTVFHSGRHSKCCRDWSAWLSSVC